MQVQPLPDTTFPVLVPDDGHASGVAWGAVLAGAAAAAALSFILLILGAGLGLSSLSPYTYNSAPLARYTIAWIVFMQVAAAGLGGYMAGRLRLKWARVHGDEVHFRDTAHGLLAWAVATLVTVALLAGGVKAALGESISNRAAQGALAQRATGGPLDDLRYYSDSVLRAPGGDSASEAQRAEVDNILAASLINGALSNADRSYLAQVLAKRSGASEPEADRRVADIYARASKAGADAQSKTVQLAEQARKAAAHSALWMFVALLSGAFVASLAATIGGRRRDDARMHLRAA